MGIVCGVGFNDGKYPSFINGCRVWEYVRWSSMIYRCYHEKYKERQPTYKDCTVSENFKNYSYFYDWCQDQIGCGLDGFELDKDLLIKGNKIYSEDTCVFIPKELNILLEDSKAIRGDNPIGVSFDKNRKKFQASIKINGKKVSLGRYHNKYDAFKAYKDAKESYIRDMAEKYKNFIDSRVYQSLEAYSVKVSD